MAWSPLLWLAAAILQFSFAAAEAGKYSVVGSGTWSECKDNCQREGKHLACVRNDAEFAEFDLVFPESRVWLGATDEHIEGVWEWAFCAQPFDDYTRWNLNQPGDYPNEHCLFFQTYAGLQGWHDGPCAMRLPCGCQARDGTTTTSTTTSSTTASSTSTSASTTTTSTSSSAIATTTSTTKGALCTTSRMMCPAPNHNSQLGTYSILGSTDEKCKLQGSAGGFFFNFSIADCNVSRIFDYAAGLVTDIVTLVYEQTVAFGAIIIDLLHAPPAQVLCTCTSPTSASIGVDLSAEDVELGEDEEIVGQGDFQAMGAVYPNGSFQTPFSSGDTVMCGTMMLALLVPAGLSRLYLDVRSASTQDLVGLDNCTVAPTNDSASNYAVEILGRGCSGGPFGVEVHPEDWQHAVQISIINFKFAGTLDIFLWCRVIRCATAPCGKCNQATRRLQHRTGRWLQEDGSSSETTVPFGSFQAPAFGVPVFPSGGPQQEQVAASWVAPPPNSSGSSSSNPEYVRTNLTLYGAASLANDDLSMVASLVSQALGRRLLREVPVIRIWLVPLASAQGRLLSSSGAGNQVRTEAVVVECGISWGKESDLVALRSLLDSADFKTSLAQELTSTAGLWPTSLQVAFGPLLREETENIAPQNQDGGNSDIASDLTVVAAVACGALVLGCFCAGSLLIGMRKCRKVNKKRDQTNQNMKMQLKLDVDPSPQGTDTTTGLSAPVEMTEARVEEPAPVVGVDFSGRPLDSEVEPALKPPPTPVEMTGTKVEVPEEVKGPEWDADIDIEPPALDHLHLTNDRHGIEDVDTLSEAPAEVQQTIEVDKMALIPGQEDEEDQYPISKGPVYEF